MTIIRDGMTIPNILSLDHSSDGPRRWDLFFAPNGGKLTPRPCPVVLMDGHLKEWVVQGGMPSLTSHLEPQNPTNFLGWVVNDGEVGCRNCSASQLRLGTVQSVTTGAATSAHAQVSTSTGEKGKLRVASKGGTLGGCSDPERGTYASPMERQGCFTCLALKNRVWETPGRRQRDLPCSCLCEGTMLGRYFSTAQPLKCYSWFWETEIGRPSIHQQVVVAKPAAPVESHCSKNLRWLDVKRNTTKQRGREGGRERERESE